MSCDCESSMDNWNQEDVQREGYQYLQNTVSFFFPEKINDDRIMQIYVGVKYIGTPPRVHGGGVYEITSTMGFDHIIGMRFSLPHIKRNKNQLDK